MTTATLPAKRGRPSATDDLRLELRAHLAEERDFAARVRVGATRLHAAAIAGRRDVVLNEAGRLGYYADRRLAQIGSVTL